MWLLAEQAVTWSQPHLDGARSVPLRTGFNLVAWTGSDNTPIAGAVAALGGALESIFLWEARAERYLTFRPAAAAFLNSAEVLNYGDGLWALMNAPATWEQPAASAPTDGVDEPDEEVSSALEMYDDNGNGRITCAEARSHGIAPVHRGHPAYEYMNDVDDDGVVCE